MNRKVAVIMGVTGQDGAYLARFLVQKNYTVIGAASHVGRAHCSRLREFDIEKRVQLVKGDATDPTLVKHLLLKFHPLEWYNLAAISSVAASWENPAATIRVNGEAVAVVVDAIRRYHPKTKMFQASSAEIFGNVSGVITERTSSFSPLNPYGIGKLAAHLSVRTARERYGLFLANGILFNHESPLRPDTFVSKKIARGVARISCGLDAYLELGNLLVQRNWTYAGDVVEAMWRMLQLKTPEDIVICSNENYSIADFVQAAFAHVGIQPWEQYVRINPLFVRKNDVKHMRGSAKHANKVLKWHAAVDFHSLVALMVNYELERCTIK